MREFNQSADPRQNLVKYAARILLGRPYFKSKLKEKLMLRAQSIGLDSPIDLVEEIITDLKKSGYLNDLYLAQAFIRRQLSKSYGSKIISLKLKRLGVDPDTLREAMSTDATAELEIESAKRFCEKSRIEDTRKLASKLYSRGYPGSIIGKVLQYNY